MTSTLEAILFVGIVFGAAALFFVETFLAICIGDWAAGRGFGKATVRWFCATAPVLIFGTYIVLLMADDTGIPENCKSLLMPAAFYPIWFFLVAFLRSSVRLPKKAFKMTSRGGWP